MRKSAIIAAIARAHGRFLEAWGSSFCPDDDHDVEALSYLVADELADALEREVERRVDDEAGRALDAVRVQLERWGSDD